MCKPNLSFVAKSCYLTLLSTLTLLGALLLYKNIAMASEAVFNGGYINTRIHKEANGDYEACSEIDCCWPSSEGPGDAQIFWVTDREVIWTYESPYKIISCVTSKHTFRGTAYDSHCDSCPFDYPEQHGSICFESYEGIRMEAGSVTKAVECGVIERRCFTTSEERVIETVESSSILNFKIDCSGAGNLFYIRASVSIEAHGQPSGSEFLVNGISPIKVEQSKITYNWVCNDTYTWEGFLEWLIPLG